MNRPNTRNVQTRTRKISNLCLENYTIDRYLISYMPIAYVNA